VQVCHLAEPTSKARRLRRLGKACIATRSVSTDTERMGLYSRYVIPRLINVAMKNKDMEQLRRVWIPRARGEVLEVGIGSGMNLSFYSSEARRVFAVDPSIELIKIAREKVDSKRLPVEFLAQSAEESLPLSDATIDTVVMTWTLCSIPVAPLALQEMRRVLKPSGQLIFVEHGLSPEPGVRAWQQRLTPLWRHFTGGCRLDRKVDDLISKAGFQVKELKTGYLPGPRSMTYTYQGIALPK
jgi:SAM-dependent methyltransferase